MIFTSLLVLLLSCVQDEIPFKAKEDFAIKLDLSFKQRADDDNGTIRISESVKDKERRTSSDPLPYLKLNIILHKVHELEVKVKVVRDSHRVILNKKVTNGSELKLEVGFVDDLKDRISGYQHEIQFYSTEKKVLSRILIVFDEEGNYFVNGEKWGKV